MTETTEQYGPVKVTRIEDEEGVDIELAEDIPINLNIRRELSSELDGPAARLIIEGDVTSVDVAFVILTQALNVPAEDLDAAIERAREAENAS